MAQEIIVIDNKQEIIGEIKDIFKKEKEFKFKACKDSDLERALDTIPALFIIDEDNVDLDILDMCQQIRSDDDNNITPLIVISSNSEKEHKLQVLNECVEYYIKKPMDKDYLYHTIKNLLRLISQNRTISPLTGLPGNVQIHAELKKRLVSKDSFSVLYLDLDNFKAYNDVYGFLKGDEIIKFTANTILRNVHIGSNTDNFVGHIGGDDFIAIVDTECYEEICQNIILEFDKGIVNYFTDADLDRGFLEVPNRKCVVEQFPITSISIGVVVVDKSRYANILEIGEVGAQVKHIAKTTMGSSYAINKRKSKNVCEVDFGTNGDT